MENSVSKAAVKRPWQVILVFVYPVFPVVLLSLFTTCTGVGKLIAACVDVFLHHPLDKFTVAASLMTLSGLLFVSLHLALAAGVYAFWRGRPVGLLCALGVMSAMAAGGLILPLLPQSLVGRSVPQSFMAVIPVALALAALLFAPAVRRHQLVGEWSIGKLLASGLAWGAIIVLAYAGMIAEVVLLAGWLTST